MRFLHANHFPLRSKTLQESALKELRPAFSLLAIFTILFGFVYPLLITGIGQILFPTKANGSLIMREGRVVGATMIGQQFLKPEYFHPRPSAAGENGYDALHSGGSNLAPSNHALINAIKERTAAAAREINGRPLPIDLVTASASGLDPHISPENASAQVARVARARRLNEELVRDLVDRFVENETFGIFGAPRVNVLALNLALDDASRAKEAGLPRSER
jgi:K+-transporting ATPase ATPase C chain